MTSYTPYLIQPRPGILPAIAGAGNLSENAGIATTYVTGDKMRFVEGWPQGFQGTVLNTAPTSPILGVFRTYKYFNLAGVDWYVIGSTMGVWAYSASVSAAVNITPLQTGTTAIANSLDSTNTSPTLTVNAAAHGRVVGERVNLAGAADFAGWTAATQINKDHIIASVPNANKFTVTLSTNATSTVSNGGGASTVYSIQIDVTDGATYPTIWTMDKLGTKLILCPGNGRSIYEWAGNTATAPTVVSGAPTQANGIFVHNGKLCAYGTDGNDSRIRNARSGDYTNWTVAVGFDAYDDIKEESDRFICHAIIGDRVYLFTETQIFAFDDVGGDDVWTFKRLSRTSGVIGANCAYEVDGIIYFMGPNNIYRINGGIIEGLIPAHALDDYSLYYGAGNAPPKKQFISYLRKYGELYFHTPSKYIAYSLKENWWAFDGTMNRTAMMSNHPGGGALNYMGINSSNAIYSHYDNGPNWTTQWDGADIAAYVVTNWRSLDGGKSRALLRGMEVGGQFDGSMKVSVDYKDDFMDDVLGSESTFGPVTVLDDGTQARLGWQIKCTYWRYKFQMAAGSYGMRPQMRELVQKAGAAHGSYANYT